MSDKIKLLEGQRLYRSLRLFFKKRQFDFRWTDESTSYFDGNTVHIIYEVNRPELRPFTPAEQRVIRYAHAYHEVGHFLFDHIDVYRDWLLANKANEKKEWCQDWSIHKKYPISMLKFYGNFGLDGRMEYLLKKYYSPTAEYLDFVNYHWKFVEGFQELGGADAFEDFRTLYGCRVLGVDITGEFHPDAVALIESQHDLFEQIYHQNSTKDCLAIIQQIMENTWPTVVEWIENDNKDVSNEDAFAEDMVKGTWSDSEEATEKAVEAVRELESNEPAAPEDDAEAEKPSPSFESLVKALERELAKDEKDVEEQEADNVEEKGSYISGGAKADYVVRPFPSQPSIETYEQQLASLRSEIAKTRKELEALVLPNKGKTQKHQRRGKIMPHAIWRAQNCEDLNIFKQTTKGKPGKDVFISLMADVSGSTGSRFKNHQVITEIRNAMITILEATHGARIGSKAYAFTADYDVTEIFKLKPRTDVFTDYNKAMLGSIHPLGGNRDAVALKYLIETTKVEAAPLKIAFMISDGAPNFYEDESEQTIRDLVQYAKQHHTQVFCIFIGDDEDGLACAKSMYGNRVIHAKKGIAREINQQIKLLLN